MATADGYTIALKAFAAGLRPEETLWVDEWSEKHAYIPRENASEPGKYNLDRTPYAREILRALSPNHPARRVVLMGASQLLKTQVALNWLMACIDVQPANFLALMPGGNLAERLSLRVANTIKITQKVVDKVAKPRSRDARNTLGVKEFDGGTLFITTAGSAKNLREIPARYLYGDEIDDWEVNIKGQGDPIKLAETRLSTYGKRAKIYYSSTPVSMESSKILKLYMQGTQHIFEVPCPHCGHYHQLEQDNLKYTAEDTRILDAWMICPACKCEMREAHKTKMILNGRWRSQSAGDGETYSYHISALNAPVGWVSWATLAGEWLEAQEQAKNNDYDGLQAYTNTRLALPYNAGTSATTGEALRNRAEDYQLRTIPDGGYVLTCAVDVHGNRLEVQVMAWGRRGEAWVSDYQTIEGSPVEQSTWDALDDYLNTPMQHINGGDIKIDACFIDSGYSQSDVFNFTRTKKRRGIVAIKGHNVANKPILSTRPSKIDINKKGVTEKKGVELWTIGTDTAKQYLWERWHLASGAGAIHFSKDLPADYFDGLTAEKRTVVYNKGRKVVKWNRPSGAYNEPLDLTVYNLAAAHYLGLHKKTDTQWRELENKYASKAIVEDITPVVIPQSKKTSFADMLEKYK